MAVTVEDFLLRYPSFGSAAGGVVQAHLTDALGTLSAGSFASATLYDRAVMLLTAHLLTLAGVGDGEEARIAAGGFALDSVASVSDGAVSVSMKQKSARMENSLYAATSYGRELALLLRTAVVRIVVGGEPVYARR